ncbi:hypothetical protein F4604DRAFT_1678439 [Suillus subluteus]|nr:hypothetical protein F4604DRAFT_1678439 [Suillus subluteus]
MSLLEPTWGDVYVGVNLGDSAGRKLDPRILQLLSFWFAMLFFRRSPIATVAVYISFYQDQNQKQLHTSAEELTCTHGLRPSGIYQTIILYPESITMEGRSNNIFSVGGNLDNKSSSLELFIPDSRLVSASLYRCHAWHIQPTDFLFSHQACFKKADSAHQMALLADSTHQMALLGLQKVYKEPNFAM